MGATQPLTAARVVELARSLPQVRLKESVDWSSITFNGKGFAWVNHLKNRAIIKATHEEREALLACEPEVFQAGWTSSTTAWVRVNLDLADPEEVFELLCEAWRMTATKRAVQAYDASGAGPGGPAT